MIVVADTGPLNYLIRLGYIEFLLQLYDRVIIPQAVLSELSHPKAPTQVRTWISTPPSWLEVFTISAPLPHLAAELGAGEREAISLALDLHPNAILIDESSAEKKRNVSACRLPAL